MVEEEKTPTLHDLVVYLGRYRGIPGNSRDENTVVMNFYEGSQIKCFYIKAMHLKGIIMIFKIGAWALLFYNLLTPTEYNNFFRAAGFFILRR